MEGEITSMLNNKILRDQSVVNEVRVMFYSSLELNYLNQPWLDVHIPVVKPRGV